ncbi:MAG: tRNA 2-thiouridine(34) synthase MnmA [Microgenomates group bacterium]
MNRGKIAVGLSGGVDSAVSALLLKKQGYEVVGVHLYCWPPKSEIEKDGLTRAEWIKRNGCRADEDKAAALKTALELAIPFKTLNFSEEYNRLVVDYFYREYEAGRTPNPDVLCNSEIKFGLFLQWAIKNGFDYIATGHYAKLVDGRLMIPKDKHKDQTYFLWKLTEKELKHVVFPLSDLLKTEVREIAKDEGLSVANRPDSQGICFVGNVPAREFLARRLQKKTGEVKNTKGEVIGTHDGVWFYTVGQRGGWRIDPKIQENKTPVYYVVDKDAKKNELVVGVGKETESQRFIVGEVNWIRGEWGTNLLVRIRHGGKLIPAEIVKRSDLLTVKLAEAQRGVAPGQSAVFYGEDGEMLGGGVIG